VIRAIKPHRIDFTSINKELHEGTWL